MIKNIKTTAKNDTIDSLLFYMSEYRDEFTPIEVARIYFREVCNYSVKVAYEIMERKES